MQKRVSDRVTPDGDHIKQLISNKGLYLNYVAERAKISERTLDKVLASKSVVIATLEGVAIALGEPYKTLVLKNRFQPVPLALPLPGVTLSCEQTAEGLVLKFQGEIKISADAPGESPDLLALVAFLKGAFPGTDIPILSIGAGAVCFLLAGSQAKAEKLNFLDSFSSMSVNSLDDLKVVSDLAKPCIVDDGIEWPVHSASTSFAANELYSTNYSMDFIIDYKKLRSGIINNFRQLPKDELAEELISFYGHYAHEVYVKYFKKYYRKR